MKEIPWFLYDKDLRHKSVKLKGIISTFGLSIALYTRRLLKTLDQCDELVWWVNVFEVNNKDKKETSTGFTELFVLFKLD